MKKTVLILTVALLFSSCNLMPSTDGHELLKAPMLNQMQKAIYDELGNTLKTSDIIYKYPKYGELRSPFVFYDLNGDGLEEVIVFFSYKDNTNQTFARVMVQNTQKEWSTFYDIPDLQSGIEFIDFAPLLTEKQSSLIVGTTDGTRKKLSVYSMEDITMKRVLDQNYTNYNLVDSGMAGISDLVLMQGSSDGFIVSCYGVKNMELTQLSWLPLYEETTSIKQTLVGQVEGYGQGIYIDEEMSKMSTSYGTEIIGVVGGKLEILAGSKNGKIDTEGGSHWANFTKTFRTDIETALSIDLGNNGTIEVPKISELDSGGDGSKAPRLVEYMSFNLNGFSVETTAVHNRDFGYLFYFPERWLGKVIIKEQPQRQEWRFYKTNSLGEATTELLRIRVFRSGEYIDEISKDDFLLGTRRLFSYYGYISQTSSEPLAITKEEVKAMFVFT